MTVYFNVDICSSSELTLITCACIIRCTIIIHHVLLVTIFYTCKVQVDSSQESNCSSVLEVANRKRVSTSLAIDKFRVIISMVWPPVR